VNERCVLGTEDIWSCAGIGARSQAVRLPPRRRAACLRRAQTGDPDIDLELFRQTLLSQRSAAANVYAAVKLLRSGLVAAKASAATLLCDTGLKY
jgi:hypothetical protein